MFVYSLHAPWAEKHKIYCTHCQNSWMQTNVLHVVNKYGTNYYPLQRYNVQNPLPLLKTRKNV